MRKNFMLVSIAALILILAGAAVLGWNATTVPRQFRIAAGSQDGMYFQFANKLKDALAKDGYRLDVFVTQGSLENVAMLKSGQVDIALVQGGIEAYTDTAGLSTLLNIMYEPVWLFYNTLEGTRILTQTDQLRRLHIGIGSPGSGTQPVALEVLNQLGINADNAVLVEANLDETVEMLRQDELNAAVIVMAPTAPLIEDLMRDPMLGVIPFRRTKAIERRVPYLREVTLYEGAIDLQKNLPPQDIKLVSTTAGIVARPDFNPNLILLLLRTSQDVLGKIPLLIGEAHEFPSLSYTGIPANEVAAEFIKSGPTPLEQLLPMEIATPLTRLYLVLLPLLVFAYPTWMLTKSAYRWYMSSRIETWYPRIREIERQMGGYSLPQVEEQLQFLRGLDAQTAQKINVSAGYLSAYYDLRRTIRFVMEQLEERRAELLKAEQGPGDPSAAPSEPPGEAASQPG